MANSPFEGLKPVNLWKQFEALTKIPRCSGNESAAADYVIAQAKAKGAEAEKDKSGNVVVRLRASKGKEKAPGVVLQGHLDMVGEKDSSSSHNFDKDPIPVVRRGEYLGANGTTLGADNGIGLAAALALLDDPEVVHGPLEILCTVDEETGLTGAQGLATSFVRGRILLNLDSEEEGALYVGCAGGADTLCTLPVKRGTTKGDAVLIQVKGLKGGHSGLDINTGRGNAIKVLADFMNRLRQKTEFGLISFEGGNKHNAIPREAKAVILLPAGGNEKAKEAMEGLRSDLKVQYGKTDPGSSIEMEKTKSSEKPLSKESRNAFLDLLLAMPHGVLAMSQEIPGLVESSTNLAVVRLEPKQAFFHESSRSSVMPFLHQVQDSLAALSRLSGAEPTPKGGYPGWQPNMDSNVLSRTKKVHEQATGKAPLVKAIHAGLECGIIGEKFGGMDMISFGPQIESPHSPSERVKIDSVEKFYKFLKLLLANIAG
jgi:dipeptidase D